MKNAFLTVLFVTIFCFTAACSGCGMDDDKHIQEVESDAGATQVDAQTENGNAQADGDTKQRDAADKKAKEIKEKDKKVQEMVSNIEIELEEETPSWCCYS